MEWPLLSELPDGKQPWHRNYYAMFSTLWGGIVGEVGWEGLSLGGHDAVGEAFVDFQRELRALKARGILLAIASKNRESVALEAMERHPEMLLRPDEP